MLDQPILIAVLFSAFAGVILALLFAQRSFARKLDAKQREVQGLSAELERLRQQSFHDKDELQAILSSMVEGVIVVRHDGRIIYVSPNASQMLQMRSKEVVDKLYWEAIRHQQINACLKDALEGQKAVNKEVVFMGAEDAFFSMQISPVVKEGKLSSVAAVFHDITELKKLLRLRSEFVANVSHELKTPLTSIKGFVETLRDEGGIEDGVNARKFLEIIHKQTERLEMLVADLLTLSSIESREAKMELVRQDLASIIQAVLVMEKKSIDRVGHEIVLELPASLPSIYVDRDRMEQVFINLLDNAVKFTQPKGRIVIRAIAQERFVRVDVEDNGSGIAPEHVNRVFERFYRADKVRTGGSGGTGLGLAIVKHIMQAHQGRVEVHSKPGSGSTFSIFIPFIK